MKIVRRMESKESKWYELRTISSLHASFHIFLITVVLLWLSCRVSLNLLQVTEHRAEPWIAFGYLCYVFGKIPRSLYFAQKAFMLNCSCLQSLILKGMGLLKTRKVPEALMHFTEARRLSPHNYEVMHGIVDCYWQRKKTGEAVSKAYEALKILGNTPRTLCVSWTIRAMI